MVVSGGCATGLTQTSSAFARCETHRSETQRIAFWSGKQRLERAVLPSLQRCAVKASCSTEARGAHSRSIRPGHPECDHSTALATNGEQWCVELEVYHNSLAAHRFVLDLLPGATHWFEVDGELHLHNMGATGAVIDNTAHQFA